MKVHTWNVNNASEFRRRPLWEMVQREDADIVLLQEVTRIPWACSTSAVPWTDATPAMRKSLVATGCRQLTSSTPSARFGRVVPRTRTAFSHGAIGGPWRSRRRTNCGRLLFLQSPRGSTASRLTELRESRYGRLRAFRTRLPALKRSFFVASVWIRLRHTGMRWAESAESTSAQCTKSCLIYTM